MHLPEWSSNTIQANGLRLHYTRCATGRPPVVLAHGITDDGLCWRPVAEALAADYDLVLADARGHGQSEAPAQGYDAANLAADLAGMIAGLGLPRPAVLGHSMGARTALMLASQHPTVARAILLEDPPPDWMPSPAPAQVEANRAGMMTWMRRVKTKTRAELIAEERLASPGWSEAELAPWADAKLRFSLNLLTDFHVAPTADWPGTLSRITGPVLLITGDPARGALVTPAAAAAFQALVPQARVCAIPNAGHSVRRDQPGPYIEAVRAFLAETAGL